MNPEQFITLASELADGATEAHYRSAISRAYYGVFHTARRLLQDMGIRLPKGEQIHMKVTFCLHDCGDALAVEAATELESLRNQRNRADYELDGMATSRALAGSQIQTARKIVDKLRQCRSGPGAAEFCAKVRAQAKLLGLPVSS
jgi:uncharacterized protein (UPF0332 family)